MPPRATLGTALRRNGAIHRLRTSRLLQISLLLFCTVGALTLFGTWYGFRCTSSLYRYAIIIDAGSSHSTLVLFRWSTTGLRLDAGSSLEAVASCEVDKGIADGYGGDHQRAAADLINCTQVELFPKLDCATSGSSVPLLVAATAGMRLLNLSAPNETASLFASIEAGFKLAKIAIKSAAIINGTEEGFYAWLATNYLAGKLSPHPEEQQHQTFGVVDLGGASMQLAQEVLQEGNQTSQNVLQANLFGDSYDVFALSNLCYGANEAFRRYFAIQLLQRDPPDQQNISISCLPKNFHTNTSNFKGLSGPCNTLADGAPLKIPQMTINFFGSGDWVKCKSELTEKVLNQSWCLEHFKYCAAEVPGTKRETFYGMGAYEKIPKGLKLTDEEGIVDKGKFDGLGEQICSWPLPWPADNGLKFPTKFHSRICFMMNLIDVSLGGLFHFTDTDWSGRLHFKGSIRGAKLAWQLGAGVLTASQAPVGSISILHSKALYLVPGAMLLFIMAATVAVMIRTGGKSGQNDRTRGKSPASGALFRRQS